MNNARIATGGALVDGKPYLNSANVDVTIPSAVGGGNTRIDRVVLRASWAAQTVRVTRIAGTDAASPTAPAITQTSGTTYDIKLCQALVDTAGTVTITDERDMAQIDMNEISNRSALSVIGRASNTAGVPADIAAASDNQVLRRSGTSIAFGTVATAGITDLAVTTAKINDLGVTSGKLAADAVIAGKIADGAIDAAALFAAGVVDTAALAALSVTSAKLGADAVIAGKIADGAVDITASLANDIVDDTKVGNRVPQFYRRQGGDASSWLIYGTTNYTPGAVRMQAGAVQVVSSLLITFPVAFSNYPIVICQSLTGGTVITVNVNSASQATISVADTAGAGKTATVFWLAIGPE